ncbi:MAG TPA: ShlB/FhaC/HecB family hemolysin secretion/activation protein [Gammaproteobacteria bacterium]|nr:ShlB/FhaC/HecB family hemolysin secretion/activation protein [Gammaproteobacteria bacterium]
MLLGSSAVSAAPPPLPPPLPAGAQPGGAQPVMPPPTIPIPETNIDLSVPPVYERPLGAEEGARVFVKKFVITGVIGDRKAGINPADIQAAVDARFADIEKVVEQERLQKQNLEKQGPEGFTPDEQDKIIKFMQGAVRTQSPDEQQRQYQEFIRQLMLERLQRLQGLTIGQLQQVADIITKFYHDRGYFLARAVIPAQEIKDGVVNVRVLEGRLAKVQANGNKQYSDEALAKPFKPLIGELVTVPRTENALLTLSQYPGLSAAGVFRPGGDVGTTDIVVNVQNEKRFDGLVRFDNGGTEFTGRRRLLGTLYLNNPTGGADLLGITALKTFGGSPGASSKYGDVNYSHPVFGAYNQLSLDLSRNSFDVGGSTGFTGLSIGGVSKIATLALKHDFERTREEQVNGTLDLSRKRADTLTAGLLSGRDDLAVLGYQLEYDAVNTNSNTIATSYVRLEHGFGGVFGVPSVYPRPSRHGDNNTPITPVYSRLVLNYQLFKQLPRNQGLLFRFNGQYSHNLLSSLEQFVIGGPDSVRAAPMSQFLEDRGVFGSLEYSIRAPGFADKHAFGSYTWGQVLRLRIFEDQATGWLNQPTGGAPPRVHAGGLGLGLEFAVPGSFTADVQWARLNGGAQTGGGNVASPFAISKSSEFWFDLTANF